MVFGSEPAAIRTTCLSLTLGEHAKPHTVNLDLPIYGSRLMYPRARLPAETHWLVSPRVTLDAGKCGYKSATRGNTEVDVLIEIN